MNTLEIAVNVGKRFRQEREMPFAQNPLAVLVRKSWPDAFRQEFKENITSKLKIKASAGMGQWNAAPFMAFLDTRITASPRSGYYPVILYERGFESFCLVLAQGADLLKDIFGTREAIVILKDRVPIIRNAVPDWAESGFTAGPFQTYSRGDSSLGRTVDDPWAVSVAFGKRYMVASPPTESDFSNDVHKMLSLYERIVQKVGRQFVEQEAIAEQLSLSGELPAAAVGLDGAIRIGQHKAMERRLRNKSLVKKVKFKHGLACQGCGVTLRSAYGEIGAEFIEAHHLTPLAFAPKEGVQLTEADFAVLCPTCHRIIHRLGCPSLDILQQTVNPDIRNFYINLNTAKG